MITRPADALKALVLIPFEKSFTRLIACASPISVEVWLKAMLIYSAGVKSTVCSLFASSLSSEQANTSNANEISDNSFFIFYIV